MSAPIETLAGPAEAMLEVKKSRHLARAEPVDSPQAALAVIERVSAAEALRTAPRRTIVRWEAIEVQVGFPHVQALHAAMAAFGAVKRDERFDAAGLRIACDLPTDAVDAFEDRLRDATRGLSKVFRER